MEQIKFITRGTTVILFFINFINKSNYIAYRKNVFLLGVPEKKAKIDDEGEKSSDGEDFEEIENRSISESDEDKAVSQQPGEEMRDLRTPPEIANLKQMQCVLRVQKLPTKDPNLADKIDTNVVQNETKIGQNQHDPEKGAEEKSYSENMSGNEKEEELAKKSDAKDKASVDEVAKKQGNGLLGQNASKAGPGVEAKTQFEIDVKGQDTREENPRTQTPFDDEDPEPFPDNVDPPSPTTMVAALINHGFPPSDETAPQMGDPKGLITPVVGLGVTRDLEQLLAGQQQPARSYHTLPSSPANSSAFTSHPSLIPANVTTPLGIPQYVGGEYSKYNNFHIDN